MSDDMYDRESSHEQYRRDRYKIKNLVFFGTESSRDFPRCTTCLEQWRLDIKDDGKGNKVAVCVRGCGRTYPLQQEQKQSKLNLKHGETQNAPILISQKSKKKDKPKFDSVNNELDDDSKKELRDMGYRI